MYDLWCVKIERLHVKLCKSSTIERDSDKLNLAFATRVVHEFNITFAFQTLVSGSYGTKVKLVANVSQIYCSLSEADILVLGRIQSSMCQHRINTVMTLEQMRPSITSVAPVIPDVRYCILNLVFCVDDVVCSVALISGGPTDVLHIVPTRLYPLSSVAFK